MTYSVILSPYDDSLAGFAINKSVIPNDLSNKDYIHMLDVIGQEGPDCWDGDIPNEIQEQADSRLFEQQVEAYIPAKARLEKYILLEGQEEETGVQETGEYEFNEETGLMEPVLEEVVIKHAIAPVEEFVEQSEYDPGTGEVTTTSVRNPVVVKDEEERTAAQAVVDATPQAVKEHVDNE